MENWEYDAPEPKRVAELPKEANSFAEVIAALRDGTIRHVYSPPPAQHLPFAAAGLRMAGLDYSEIAEVLDLCRTPKALQTQSDITTAADRARSLTAEGLATLTREDDRSRDHLRDLTSARIDALIAPLWGIATDPDHASFLAASKLVGEHIDRHVKLNGLNAPAEHIIHTPGAERIVALVRELSPMEDADVFETAAIEDAIVIGEDIL